MERKQGGEERVQNSKITINGDDENLSLLKREIACHSLFSLMVESHLNCLKVSLSLSLLLIKGFCLSKIVSRISYYIWIYLNLDLIFIFSQLCLGKMENNAINNPSDALPNQHANLFTADRSELDKFMVSQFS